MAGLPRSIIKKYGVTKKAWEIYRGGGGASHPKKHHRSRRSRVKGGKMARRRYRSRGGGGGSMVKQLAFGAGAGALVQMFSPVKGLVPSGAAGFLVGKIPGAAGGAAAAYFMSGSTNLADW